MKKLVVGRKKLSEFLILIAGCREYWKAAGFIGWSLFNDESRIVAARLNNPALVSADG